jgi:hypothetical protein
MVREPFVDAWGAWDAFEPCSKEPADHSHRYVLYGRGFGSCYCDALSGIGIACYFGCGNITVWILFTAERICDENLTGTNREYMQKRLDVRAYLVPCWSLVGLLWMLTF